MNVSGATSAHAAQVTTARRPEATEGKGPDHDGDGDDKAVSAVPAAASKVGTTKGGALYM